jgi:hypothetical protein
VVADFPEVCRFGEKLGYQTVCVFIRAAVLRTIGLAEVYIDVELRTKCLRLRERRAIVESNGLICVIPLWHNLGQKLVVGRLQG